VIRDGAMRVNLPHLTKERDRHGNERLYFRRGKGKRIRLRAVPGTQEFLEEYARAEGRGRPARTPAGSLDRLCQAYYRSADYRGLDVRTRHVRKLILDGLCAKVGEKPAARLEAEHISAWRDARMETPEAANSIVKALRQVFRWAVKAGDIPGLGRIKTNPARDVAYLRSVNPDGWHTWTIEEIEQYRETYPIGTKARLALELLLFTGDRRSDVVKLGRQMARDGWFRWTETKGSGRAPKHRAIPILPELQAVIDASPTGDMVYLITTFGKPYTANGFGNWFKRQCRGAGLPHCSAHGLRKAGATIAAENGATTHQLMAIFGWESVKQAELYTRRANKTRLAGEGMHLLSLTKPASSPHRRKRGGKSGA
jgi:integrase